MNTQDVPKVSAAPAGAASLTPVARLAASRARLRQALQDSSAPAGAAGDAASGSSLSAAWLDSLKTSPVASMVVEAARNWWAQQPLRVAGTVVADAAKAVLQPMAQRNPLGLVLGAALLGGLLAWSRPWRWILTPTLLAGLLPQLLAKAMAHVPAQSWLAVLTSLAQEPAPKTNTSSPTIPEPLHPAQASTP